MTSRRTILGLAGAATVAAGTAIATSGSSVADSGGHVPDGLKPGGKLDRLAKKMADKDEFCGTLLVSRRGRTVLTRAYGMANKDQSIPVRKDTRFDLASVTKLFTAVSVAQLVQKGAVKYIDPLGSFVDGLPSKIAEKVTVHHLLTHTSGLGDHHFMPGFWEAAKNWKSPEDVMDGTTEFIRKSELSFPPGAGWKYSNSGYHMLGEIVAKVSEQSYYDYVRERVLTPADMHDTDFFTKPQWKDDPSIARPYRTLPSGERFDEIDEKLFIGSPPGGAFSTGADLERFALALFGEQLLDPAHTHITLSPKYPMPPRKDSKSGSEQGESPARVSFLCYGPMAMLSNDHWTVGHGGGSQSASTSFDMHPDGDWFVAVLSNYPDASLPLASLARELITER